jgi:micrococcal nuclease
MNRPPPDIEPTDTVRLELRRSELRAIKWCVLALAILVSCLMALALVSLARADTMPGPSIHVIDGDTVRLPSGEVIRIWNIDAPETARARCEAEAALGRRATARLGQLLRAGPVAVVMDEPAGRREDRYGRTLARLTVAGRDIGEIMIRDGLATRWPQRRDWCGRG